MSRASSRANSIWLSVALAAGSAAAAEPPLCATVMTDKIVSSRSSKAAQERLRAEFDPRFAAVDPLAWAYDPAALMRSEAARPVRQAYERRRNEEVHALFRRASEIYLRLGTAQGFKLLLQNDEQEPAFHLDKSVTRAQCTEVVDLTSLVVEALDRGAP